MCWWLLKLYKHYGSISITHQQILLTLVWLEWNNNQHTCMLHVIDKCTAVGGVPTTQCKLYLTVDTCTCTYTQYNSVVWCKWAWKVNQSQERNNTVDSFIWEKIKLNFMSHPPSPTHSITLHSGIIWCCLESQLHRSEMLPICWTSNSHWLPCYHVLRRAKSSLRTLCGWS